MLKGEKINQRLQDISRKTMNKYHGPKDYLEAARSPETSSAELDNLAKSTYSFVRTAVAANHKTEANTLYSLIPNQLDNWNEQELARAIVQNPNSTINILSILGKKLLPVLDNGRKNHVGFQAGIILCSNPKTPFSIIELILNPDNSSVQFRKVVARETSRRDVLELLINDRSETVRRKAQVYLLEMDDQAT